MVATKSTLILFLVFLIGDFQYHFGHAELKSSIQVVKVVSLS